MGISENKAASLLDPETVGKKTPRPDHVRALALFTVGVTAFSLAVGYSIAHAHALDHFHVPCWEFSFLPCDHLTDRDEVAVNAIWLGLLSCVALMAAGAVLIPCGRRWVNRALVCLGLALATAANCLYATAACMFLVAHLGDLFSRILCIVGIFAYALGLPGPPSME
ncbi:hypothetical protein ZWY2020_029979 [Hordeum vulgare]|nr:hypothetical protein ZWY2020_029979 [Hordeum vulgare]